MESYLMSRGPTVAVNSDDDWRRETQSGLAASILHKELCRKCEIDPSGKHK